MSFEHPNSKGQNIRDVERAIMARPAEHDSPNLDLDRMGMMLDLLGHPEHSFRVIHVTGTNGKGSTVRMAEALVYAPGSIHRPTWSGSTSGSPSTARSFQTRTS